MPEPSFDGSAEIPTTAETPESFGPSDATGSEISVEDLEGLIQPDRLEDDEALLDEDSASNAKVTQFLFILC